MAKNDDPEAARRAQDVVGYAFLPTFQFYPRTATPRRLKNNSKQNYQISVKEIEHRLIHSNSHLRSESAANTHVGRGGAANVFRPSKDESAIADEKDLKADKPKGLADKGKEFLFGKKD